MLTRDIVSKWQKLEHDLKQLQEAVGLIEDEQGTLSTPYKMMYVAMQDKQKELNSFNLIEWEEEK